MAAWSCRSGEVSHGGIWTGLREMWIFHGLRALHALAGSLMYFGRSWTHGGGLPRFGVNANQRNSAHSAAAGGNHVAASPQIRLHWFWESVWH